MTRSYFSLKKVSGKQILFIILTAWFFCSCQQKNHAPANDFVSESLEKLTDSSVANQNKRLLNQRILDTLAKRPNDSLSREQLFKVANFFFLKEDYKSCKIPLQYLQKASMKAKDSSNLALSYRSIGFCYLNTKEYDSAYYYYLKAVKLYSQMKNKYGLATCYYKLSILQSNIYDNWNAQLSAIKAYKYAKECNNVEIQHTSLMMLAIILHELRDYESAIEKNKEALSLIDKSKDASMHTESCINNIGANYQDDNKHEIAILYFKRVLENENIKKEYPELYARLLSNIAFSNIKLKKIKGAESLLMKALEIRLRYPDQNDIINSYNNLTEYYLTISDTASATYYGKKALQIASKKGNAKSLLISLMRASEYDKKNAGKYINQYARISDSLQLAERQNRNKFARIAFETQEIATEKDTAIRHKWIILVVTLVLLLAGSFLFIIRMQRARARELVLIQRQKESDEAIYQLIHDQQLRIEAGRQAEKRRIALELHDGVMNRLASTRLNLYALKRKSDDETIRKSIAFINNLEDVEKELQQVSDDLNTEVFLKGKDFGRLLESLVSEQAGISDAEIHFNSDNCIDWETIDGKARMNIYRLLQEALENCRKHAGAGNIHIGFLLDGENLSVTIGDDGCGFNTESQAKGIGLVNMRRRVETLSGEIDIQSGQGRGTTINIRLPLSKISVS